MIKQIVKAQGKTIARSVMLSAFSGLLMTTILYRLNLWMADGMTLQAKGQAVIFVLAVLLCGAGLLLSNYLVARLTVDFLAELRRSLLDRIMQTSIQRLDELGSSSLYARLTLDVNVLADSLAVLPNLLYNLIIVCLLMLFMWSTSPILFYAFCSCLLLVFVVVQLSVILRGTRYYQQLRDAEEDMYDCYRGVIFGAKELAVSAKRRLFYRDEVIAPAILNIRQTEFRAQYLWSVNSVSSQTATFVVIGVLALLTDAGYAKPEHLLLFVLIILYLMGPLLSVFSSFPLISRSVVSYQRICQLTGEELPVDKTLMVGSSVVRSWQQISCEQVVYQYQSDDYRFKLGPINLTIRRGELIYLIGGNGSGKSTLFRLLAGLYQPQQGEIRVDGQLIGGADLAGYRELFGCIFTDFHLFRHVLDNGGCRVADNTIGAALTQLQLSGKLSSCEGQLSTLDLSTGQRKRLAYLQCTAQGKDIYLFDEWAADQDPQFKDYFYTELLPQLQDAGKTVIVISHDDRFFQFADRVLKLDDGVLTELRPEAEKVKVVHA